MTAKEKENQKKTCSWSRWFLFRAKQSSAQFTESDTLKMLARCDIGHLESTSTIRAVVSEFHGDQGPPTLAFDTDTDWMQNDMQKANEITTRKKQPWIIAHAHRPMYCANTERSSHCEAERQAVRLGIMSTCADTYASRECVFRRGGGDLLRENDETEKALDT